MFALCLCECLSSFSESLEILLGTFHRLLADFSGQVSSAVHVQVYKLRQSLKAVCTILAGVETIGITDGVAKLESLISAIAVSITTTCGRTFTEDGYYFIALMIFLRFLY